MNTLDIIGFRLAGARRILQKEGKSILSVEVTAPPRHKSEEYDDSFRVIRLIQIDKNNVGLLVCNPDI